MRASFIAELTALAANDERIVLLTGDLGYLALEPFAEKFPQRFFNMGIAEQNMVGVASGLAESGYLPFVYSIVTFATLRPYEFIRNGPIQHQFPVRIVGVGGGFEYGTNGLSHYGLEDVAVMRAQPGIAIVTPADAAQTRTALRSTYSVPGPVYYRLGKDEKSAVPELDGRFDLAGPILLGDGQDALLISMGNISFETARAAALLRDQGIDCTHAVMGCMAPLEADALVPLLARFPLAIAVEAHYINGGLGSLVAEVIAENGLPCKLIRKGVGQLPQGISGSQSFLYRRHGLAPEQLANSVQVALGRTS